MSADTWEPFWRQAKCRWILPYKDAAGTNRQHVIPPESAPTKKHRAAALEYARGWREQQKSTGAVPAVRSKDGPSARALRDRWIALRRGAWVDGHARYAPATLDDYEEQLDSRVLVACGEEKGAIGDIPIPLLDTPRLRAWVRCLAGEVSSSRARNVFSTFRSLVDDAMAENWVSLPGNPLRQPAVERELPAARRSTGLRPVVIALEHVQRVIACSAVPDLRRVRYLVDACTGMSEGELAGRVWADFDLGERPTVEITTALPTRGPEGWATIGRTKNEHRVRKIPLHSAAAEALRWWWREGWANYVGRFPRPTDPVFPGPEGKFSRPASAELLRRDLRAAGCPDTAHGHPVTAQALRRCFSTFLDAAGVPEEVRGRLMGHAGKTVTAKHYTANQVETDRAAVELIALRWVAPEPPHVPDRVPDHVPPAHESAKSAEPPSRLELETYGLRTRPGRVPRRDVRGAPGRVDGARFVATNGADAPDGVADLPAEVRACADGLASLRATWAALDAFHDAGASDL